MVETSDNAESRHRWYQFSLRTLFVVVTALAVCFAFVAWQLRIVAARNRVRQWLSVQEKKSVGGWTTYQDDEELSWIRKLLGDNAVLEVNYPPDTAPPDVDRVKTAFPEAWVHPFPSPEPSQASKPQDGIPISNGQ